MSSAELEMGGQCVLFGLTYEVESLMMGYILVTVGVDTGQYFKTVGSWLSFLRHSQRSRLQKLSLF